MPTTSLFSAGSFAVCKKASNQAGSPLSCRLPFNVSLFFFVSFKFLPACKRHRCQKFKKNVEETNLKRIEFYLLAFSPVDW